MENIKKYVEFKLELNPEHDHSDEELMKMYQEYLEDILRKNSELDVLIQNVNATTFD